MTSTVPKKSLIGCFVASKQGNADSARLLDEPGVKNYFPLPSTIGTSPAFAAAESDRSSRRGSRKSELGPDSANPLHFHLAKQRLSHHSIIEPLDIGNRHKTQVVLAEFSSGSQQFEEWRTVNYLFVMVTSLN